jgi:hypothetical protein
MQPRLISSNSGNTQALLELFPGIWQTAEKISSPNVQTRKKALVDLRETQAARVSPLIAYLLATRILDPDISFRTIVIEDVSKLMAVDGEGEYADEEVRSQIIATLSTLDISGLMALLEAAVWDESQVSYVSLLVNYVPKAGEMLQEIVADRSQTIPVRGMAVKLLGQVGYVAALSELERIQNRLKTRQAGQRSMPFAPTQSQNELDLLPALKHSITILRAIS